MQTVRAVVAELPELMETMPLLRVAIRPNGETNVARARVPLKPLRLAKVMVDVAHELRDRLRLVGLALIEKSWEAALLLKVAV